MIRPMNCLLDDWNFKKLPRLMAVSALLWFAVPTYAQIISSIEINQAIGKL